MSTSAEHIRAFNRAWTQMLGLLDQGVLDSEYSLAEGRIFFELGQCASMERQVLRDRLGMDASYLTRVLGKMARKGLLTSRKSPQDGRALVLSLTPFGRATYEELNQRSTDQVDRLLTPLTREQESALVESTAMISHLIGVDQRERQVTLRDLKPGDLGWAISRNGALYADQFGWDTSFEVLAAQVLIDYQTNFKPGRENGWIAEVNGARAGCVFCRERDHETAQLRVLMVEPWARGAGLGRRLVNECIAFAKTAGYSKMMLWTMDTLVSARRIYKAAGFELVEEEAVEQFGFRMSSEIWEMDLSGQGTTGRLPLVHETTFAHQEHSTPLPA